jgi:hypothetical protein
MKKYILTVSIRFPKTHPRKGESTGFPLAIKHYDKIHTIRKNYDLWEKRFAKIAKGEAYLSVRIWTGEPYKSKQAEIFKYFKEHNIGLEKLEDPTNALVAWVNGTKQDWETIAKNDGLSFFDFCDWFKIREKKPMAIIHFTNFRYAN